MIAFDGSNLSLQLMNLYIRTHNIEDIRNASVTYKINTKNILETVVNGDSTLKPASTKDELKVKMQAYSLREDEMDVWDAIFEKQEILFKLFQKKRIVCMML